MELLVLAGLVSAAIVGWWHWENHVKQVQLEEFGMEAVKRVLLYESEAVQASIRQRGSMTRAQWEQMNKALLEAIDKELARRKGKE